MNSTRTAAKAATRSPRRFELRNLTSQAHASLDDLVGPFDSLQSYRRYLGGIAAFRLSFGIEKQLADWRSALGDWRPNRIDDQLLADLTDLGVEPPALAFPAFVAESREDLLGALYVLEGSALGAKILFRRAEELGLRADYGARHLAKQSSASTWASFVALLEQAEPLDIERTAAASIAAFRAAERAFKEVAHVAR